MLSRRSDEVKSVLLAGVSVWMLARRGPRENNRRHLMPSFALRFKSLFIKSSAFGLFILTTKQSQS